MKKILIALLLACSGCLSSTDIDCWYPGVQTPSFGEPWLVLHGRTAHFREDVYGPVFKSEQEMESFIKANNLKICGRNQ